ncbi:MAG: hypothetical protein JSS96_02145 [Bacteroidetes bacterium]|nr:hypothetical protein [Bacteroidota bacterium]
MSDISIQKIDHSYNEWLNSLDFYLQEIGILKERLTEIGGKNTSQDVSKELEHYENQFTVQRDNMERLKHNIRSSIHNMSDEAKKGAGHVNGAFQDQFSQLKALYEHEETVVNELRHNFNRFSADWM